MSAIKRGLWVLGVASVGALSSGCAELEGSEGELRTLSQAVLLAPDNDECGSATVIAATPYSDMVDMYGATEAPSDPGQTCRPTNGPFLFGVDRNVWYEYVAPSNGTLHIETQWPVPGHTVSVHEGSCGGSVEGVCEETVPPNSVGSLDFLVTGGSTYLIQIGIDDSFGPDLLDPEPPTPPVSPLFMQVDFLEAPDNDLCTAAETIGTTPYTDSVDMFGATELDSDPDQSCRPTGGPFLFGVDRNVWYEYVAPSNGTLHIETQWPVPGSTISVHAGSCGAAAETACGETVPPDSTGELDVLVTAGTTYLIQIGIDESYGPDIVHPVPPGPPVSPLSVQVDFLAAPDNDLCTAAETIGTTPYTDSVDMFGATELDSDPDQSCRPTGGPFLFGVDRNVWYEYVAPSDGTLHIETQWPAAGSTISVHAGSCGAAAETACEETVPPDSTGELDVLVTAGTTYLVQIGIDESYGPDIVHPVPPGPPVSPLFVQVDFLAAPANDLCSAATVITAPYFGQVDMFGATELDSDPDQSCRPSGGPFLFGVDRNVWYEYTAPVDGTLHVETQWPVPGHAVSVHTGSCGAAAEAACEETVPPNSLGNLDFLVTAGTTYLIQIGIDESYGPDIVHPVPPGPPVSPMTVIVGFDPFVPPDPCDPDVSPPVVTAPAAVSVASCLTHSMTNVGTATATDDCTAVTPTGQVIATNGVTLPTPIPVVGGYALLGIGTHTIRWSASDGTNVSQTLQTVVVKPAIQSRESFQVQDRAAVRTLTNVGAAVFNSGTSEARIGLDALSGGIASVGPIVIRDRAKVQGSVTSPALITIAPSAQVTGPIVHQPVTLPSLATLPAFPPAGSNVTVNSGTTNLAAGSYNNVTVNGGILNLGAGDYFIRSLTINSGVTVRALPTTRLFVMNQLSYKSAITKVGGARQPILLGFVGTTLNLEAGFDGTLLAPNAKVSFGIGSGLLYTGAFFARILEVRPASTLVCDEAAVSRLP
jgi:hypothetical protein